MNDILNRIIGQKRQWLAKASAGLSRSRIEEMLGLGQAERPVRGFVDSIERSLADRGVAVIAECKQASPSAGLIRQGYDAAEIALGYERAGAACISVLTEEDNFQGRSEHMRSVARACGLPVLCKDFIFDEWQIAHARLCGADCVLLIAAVLDDARLGALSDYARELGLAALVEVHDEEELGRCSGIDASLIGINNRNLKDLSVSLDTSIRLRGLVPEGRMVVSESGISSVAAMRRLGGHGLGVFLIGEHLLRQADPGRALADLLAGASDSAGAARRDHAG